MRSWGPICSGICSRACAIVGGRSGAYEKELKRAKSLAIEEMVEEAAELGADAIVGVDLDYEHLGADNRSMLMVSANGTAVKLA
jgi:uncharacterized protein YbjQ (UPF0145 family)